MDSRIIKTRYDDDDDDEANIGKLESVQRRAARWVSGRFHQRSSVSDMLAQLKWPLLQRRRTESRLVMLYKIQNNLLALDASQILLPMSGIAQGANPHKLLVPQVNTLLHGGSFYPRTIKQWNRLDASVVLGPSPDKPPCPDSFRGRLRQVKRFAKH